MKNLDGPIKTIDGSLLAGNPISFHRHWPWFHRVAYVSQNLKQVQNVCVTDVVLDLGPRNEVYLRIAITFRR